MIAGFIHIRFLDFLDILIVSFLLYQLYNLIKGTVAIRIFSGILIIYLIWLIVKSMKMELISSILGQVIGVGMIALIVVFQQEIRQFLLMLGNKYIKNGKFNLIKNTKLYSGYSTASVEKIVTASINMASTRTGALIVISRDASLKAFAEQGEIINADINSDLIMSIFYKDSPLHDGAILIENNKLFAARCILPVSSNPDILGQYGLRHRSALGMAEITDTIVVVVSEQTGEISIAHSGRLYKITEPARLTKMIFGFLGRGVD